MSTPVASAPERGTDRAPGRAGASRPVVRVGTRRSLLATTQAGHVAELIRTVLDREVELVEVTTEGDRSQSVGTPLAAAGGAGVFVGALRDALLRGDVARLGGGQQRTTGADADHRAPGGHGLLDGAHDRPSGRVTASTLSGSRAKSSASAVA